MKVAVAAAVFALAAPGVAAGAGLSLALRDLDTTAATRVPRFQLVGLHWRGSGAVFFRTRSLTGRWSAWRSAEPEDALPAGRGERSAVRSLLTGRRAAYVGGLAAATAAGAAGAIVIAARSRKGRLPLAG